MKRVLLPFLALLASCGLFDKKSDPKPNPASPAASAPVVPSAAATASAITAASAVPTSAPTSPLATGKGVELTRSMLAIPTNDGVRIIAANKPYTCSDFTTESGQTDTQHVLLEVDFPFGPGGTFFAGHPIGVRGQFDDMASTDTLDASQMEAQLDSGDGKPGSHMKGWANLSEGYLRARGTFDAVVCPPGSDVKATHPSLSPTATGPLSGEVGGEKFVAKKVLARMGGHSSSPGVTYVMELHVFGVDDVTCADVDPLKPVRTPQLFVTQVGGTSSKADLSGTMQPAEGVYWSSTWKRGKSGALGAMWVRFDKLDHEKLDGTLQFASDKGGIGGTFTAEVCSK